MAPGDTTVGSRPGRTTTNASLVAQQQEAQRRFEQNSADLEAQRAARRELLERAITDDGKRDRAERAVQDRTRQKDGRER